MIKRFCFALLLLSCGCAAPGVKQPREFDFGFIASRLRDPDGNLRLRVAGPIYERAVSTNGATVRAFRPFYGGYTDPVTERSEGDILWPIFAAKDFRNEFSWRFLLTYYLNWDVHDPQPRYHLWALPIYFQGRDSKKETYHALFPIGGNIHEFLGRDQIHFVLFPIYARSSVNEVKTKDIVWPIYSRTEGEGICRYRVFPFYGRNHHRDRFEKRFILWPFWTWAHYSYTNSSGTAYILWPLWGHFDLEDQKAWLFIPPFIRLSSGQRLNYNYCPWPFVQWSSGEIEKFYLWPLWGKKNMPGYRSAFFLWPIFRTERLDRGEEYGQRFLALPFILSEVRKQRSHDPKVPSPVIARYHKLWPLLSYQQEGDKKRFRCLDLWPLKNTGPIEREYAPIWTLYSHTTVGDSYDDELLWGLYRNRKRGSEFRAVSLFPLVEWTRDDRGGERREWALLKGLLGYEREGSKKTWRMLYFLRLGGKEKK